MPMLMRPSPLALEKISGFPSSWPSPIFIKIFSWVVSQAIGVLKPQKLSTNYSPNYSMVRPTTRTITSPCLRCLQSMRQRGLDMNISSGDLPSNPPNSQTNPWIIPRIMASRLAQRPHKKGVAITSLTAKSGSLAGLISALCKFSAKAQADATASTSTATHQISGTYDLSPPWFPRRYNNLDLWWSYRLTILPFNEFYEGETRTIWCKTVEDHQKSKWKGYGSCVFVLVHPKRHGIHSMSATTLKGP